MRSTTIRVVVCAASAMVLYLPAAPGAEAQWTNPQNLGAPINSPGDELGPFVYQERLFYSSDAPGGLGGYDVYMSARVGSEWDVPENVLLLNSIYNERAPSVACVDGFPEVVYGSDRLGSYDVWWSANEDSCPFTPPELWIPPLDLPDVNSPDFESMPTIAPDGSALYFGSDRPEGFGGYDIYVSYRLGPGWTEPENLGPVINSTDNEGGPSLSGDGLTLYFSSNRPGGEGGIDLYMSQWVDGTWTAPVNLGPEINSTAHDTCPQESEDEFYFRSTRPGGLGAGDLYVASRAEMGWSEDFDGYNTTDPLPDQSTWQPWNDDPAAANFFATTAQSRSRPNSVAIDNNDDAVHQYSDYTSGRWVYTAWVYVPMEMNDTQYFILLNTYPASVLSDWSLQIELDAGAGFVNDFNSAASLPMVKGEWAQIRVDLNLDQDEQSAYYNGALLVTKGWTDGVAPGGALNIAAVDLWGNGSASEVYYDDMSIRRYGTDRLFLHGPDFDPYEPVESPIGMWHELWPAFCRWWDCTDWIDNGNGYLDWCDYVYLELPFEAPGWWHVEDVTVTVTLEPELGSLPEEWSYLDYQGPFIVDPFNPVGPWHEIYPDYCTDWECVDWLDNGDGIVGFCDWLVFETPFGFIDLHVVEVATDIEVIREDPPTIPRRFLDGPDFDPYEPLTDPTGLWHELWPDYCVVWECTDWEDNGNDVLDYCDYLLLENGEASWWHVEWVTLTLGLEGPPPYAWQHFEWMGEWPPPAMFDPIGPWWEVYPDFCTEWECLEWDDTNDNGIVDFCDWLLFFNPMSGDEVWLHVVEVATDLEIALGSPPCPEDVNGDGVVDILDLLAVLAAWGSTQNIPEDVNGDGIVDILDLLAVLAAWGPC